MTDTPKLPDEARKTLKGALTITAAAIILASLAGGLTDYLVGQGWIFAGMTFFALFGGLCLAWVAVGFVAYWTEVNRFTKSTRIISKSEEAALREDSDSINRLVRYVMQHPDYDLVKHTGRNVVDLAIEWMEDAK